VTSQTAHTKYKWLPYAAEWTPPMKSFCVRHCFLKCKIMQHLPFQVLQKEGDTYSYLPRADNNK